MEHGFKRIPAGRKGTSSLFTSVTEVLNLRERGGGGGLELGAPDKFNALTARPRCLPLPPRR